MVGTLSFQRESKYCTLEVQSRWVAWREAVIAMDLSWNRLSKFGDSLIGFALSVVYGTVITTSMKSKRVSGIRMRMETASGVLIIVVRFSISYRVARSHYSKEGTH